MRGCNFYDKPSDIHRAFTESTILQVEATKTAKKRIYDDH